VFFEIAEFFHARIFQTDEAHFPLRLRTAEIYLLDSRIRGGSIQQFVDRSAHNRIKDFGTGAIAADLIGFALVHKPSLRANATGNDDSTKE
jgi:hypothetical protein